MGPCLGPIADNDGKVICSAFSPFFLQERAVQVPKLTYGSSKRAYQGFVFDLLPDELVLTQGVAGLSCDGVDGALLHLLLDGTEQGEEGLPSTLLRERRIPD